MSGTYFHKSTLVINYTMQNRVKSLQWSRSDIYADMMQCVYKEWHRAIWPGKRANGLCQYWSERISKKWKFNLNLEGCIGDPQPDKSERRNCKQTRVGGMLQTEEAACEKHRGMTEVVRTLALLECEILRLGTWRRRIFGVHDFALWYSSQYYHW